MKRLFHIVGIILPFLVSCVDRDIPVQSQSDPVRHTIYAAMPQPDEGTRVSVQNNGSILWTPGDSFTAFNAENQSATFTLAEIEYVKNGTFHSSDDVLGNFTYAAMPAKYHPTFDGTNITFTLPNTYTIDDNSQNAAMWGNVTDDNVKFHHLMGVLKVYVDHLPYEFTQIKVEASLPIAGKFTQTLEQVSDGLVVSHDNTDERNKVVTITRTLTHAYVYVPIPAGTYHSIKVKAIDPIYGGKRDLVDASNKTVKCGFMYRVGKPDVNQDVFAKLNLDYPGLEEVKAQYQAGDLNKAAIALLDYYRHRTNVVNPEIENLTENATFRNQANQALEYRFVVAKFVEDDKGTTDTKSHADDVYYSFKNDDGSINWGFCPNVQGVDREFNYQQHRHQWMEPQAKAYAVTKNEEYVKSWMEVYSSWMKRYPCPNISFANPNIKDLEPGYEWKALQPAMRVISQLNSIPLFIQSANFTPEFFTTVLNAFAESVEMIRMNYIEKGNIRLTQGEAVTKAGLLMPEFKNANLWLEDGASKIDIDEQFLTDGLHVDLCLGYHMGALGSFVKINTMAEVNNRRDIFSPEYIRKLKNAVDFVEAMIYPNYTVDNFNDSHSISYSKGTLQNRLREYAAIFPEDEGLKWMAWEGSKGGVKPAWQNRAFNVGGYYMLRSKEWSETSGLMVIHTNNYNPTKKWHCQPDNGTFSLWYNGTNFLPDAGYYTYADPDPTGNRKLYRRYTLHNTISCFGKEMLETRQNGRMLHQESGKDYELIVTENMPYQKGDSGIAGDIYHRRAIYLVDNKFLVLVDEGYSAEPGLNVKLNLNFHLYAEKNGKAEIVHQPSAEEKYGLVKTNLKENNLLMKFFTDTKTCSNDFKIDSPSDIKVSNAPGKAIGETRNFIRVTERKNASMGAARFITVIYPSAGPANVDQSITARFTDNAKGQEGTFHPEGSAVEVTVDGKTYQLAYTLSE